MMELKYQVVENNCQLCDFHFDGLTGRERVPSVAGALEMMQIKSPLSGFEESRKAGAYDSMDKSRYKRLCHSMERISSIWRAPGDLRLASAPCQLSPMVLLQNAIEEIIHLDELLWDSGWYTENEKEED